MPRTDLFLKVVIDHDEHESPERLAEEIVRRLTKIHAVRSAELSSYVTRPEEGEAL